MRDFTNDIPAVQPPQPVNYHVNMLGLVVTGANILVSGVLVGAMYFDSHSATAAALAGVAYFGLSTSLALLTLSGSLSQIITNGQNNKTTRLLYRLQYKAQAEIQRLRVVDPMQIPYTNPVQETMQLPENTTFVQPHAEADDSAKREAAAWILQLYGAGGQPDPKKVLLDSEKERPGRVRIASPSRPAKQYLLDRHIIHDLGNGYRLNLIHYPTAQEVQGKLL